MSVDPTSYGCTELQRLMYEYAERELTYDILIALDNHLLVCAECQEAVESYKKSSLAVREHIPREVQLPADVRDQLLRTLASQ